LKPEQSDQIHLSAAAREQLKETFGVSDQPNGMDPTGSGHKCQTRDGTGTRCTTADHGDFRAGALEVRRSLQ
jgi:hypothetical protein